MTFSSPFNRRRKKSQITQECAKDGRLINNGLPQVTTRLTAGFEKAVDADNELFIPRFIANGCNFCSRNGLEFVQKCGDRCAGLQDERIWVCNPFMLATCFFRGQTSPDDLIIPNWIGQHPQPRGC